MSYTDVLKRIGGVAQDMVSFLHQPSPLASSALPSLTPTICVDAPFPPPMSLVPSLVEVGLDRASAEALSNSYIKAANVFRDQCEAEYSRACTALISVSDNRGSNTTQLRSKFRSVLIARYRNILAGHADMARKKAELKLQAMNEKGIHVRTDSVEPTSFNHNCAEFCFSGLKENRPSNTPPSTYSCKNISTICSRSDMQVSVLDRGSCTIRPVYAYPTAYPPPDTDAPQAYRTFARLPPLYHVSTTKNNQNSMNCEIQCCIELFSRITVSETEPLTRTTRSTLAKTFERAPAQISLSTNLPPYRFPPKMKLYPRPASPVLDTSPTIVMYHNPSSDFVALTSNLNSYGVRSCPSNGRQTRKVAPLPRRQPPYSKHANSIPSSGHVRSPALSISRVPSLTSESSCESNASSPILRPVTPQTICTDLSPFLPEVSPICNESDPNFPTEVEDTTKSRFSGTPLSTFSVEALSGTRS